MPYCAKCLVEYVDGTTQCEDCGAALAPGSPPAAPPRIEIAREKDINLVSLRTFTGGTAPMDAEVARGVLESQGISSALTGEGTADPFPVTEVHLLVREEDAKRAETLLEEFLDAEVVPSPEESEAADER